MITRTAREGVWDVRFQVATSRPLSVVGDFNHWCPESNPLVPDDDGTRSTVVTLPPGRFAFRYLADNGAFLDDVDADEHEPNGYGQLHSVVVVKEISISNYESGADSDGTASVGTEASDDLIRVDGIGPKIADALHAAGIASFGALASASEFSLRSALKAAGLRSHPTLPTWAAQAQKFAGG